MKASKFFALSAYIFSSFILVKSSFIYATALHNDTKLRTLKSTTGQDLIKDYSNHQQAMNLNIASQFGNPDNRNTKVNWIKVADIVGTKTVQIRITNKQFEPENSPLWGINGVIKNEATQLLNSRLKADPKDFEAVCCSSGVLWKTDNTVLTAYHVIENAEKIELQTYDGVWHVARPVYTNFKTDIAELQFDSNKIYSPINVAKLMPKQGQEIALLAATDGDVYSMSTGIVSRYNYQNKLGYGNTYMQSDLVGTFGSSGGAVVNANAELVGIVVFGSDYFTQAIPANRI